MEVVLAESAGFCYGVKRALDTVLEAAKDQEKPMLVLGPLIHNPQVIERLKKYGVMSVTELDEVEPGSVVVMPSHGVVRQVMESAVARELEVVDVTCPFVEKVHRLAESLVKQGYQVIIIGDEGHTEVRGILSRAGEDAFAVSEAEELGDRKIERRVGILAQTTQTMERFHDLVAEITARTDEVRAYNTICNATVERQHSALETARSVDIMIVVGGRNSANTRQLAEICAQTGVPTHHVEVADEIDPGWFGGASKVGVTAGASTPDWIISEVISTLEGITPAK